VLNNKLKINKLFYHLIYEIYKNSVNNKEFFFYKTNLNLDIILSLFTNLGYITHYIKYSNFYYIKLKNNIFVYAKNSLKIKNKNKTILLKELINFHKNYGGINGYILNTDKGLVMNYTAINKRVGGKLLLMIV
jgi:ribosomal protein S8